MKLSEAVELYIRLRDKKAEIAKERKAEEAAVQEKMDKLELQLMSAFDKMGVDSMKTESGTAYTSTRTSATISDKDSFMLHVKTNLAWDLLETRVSKSAVDAYAAEHGDVPPGINLRTERTVNVRRS